MSVTAAGAVGRGAHRLSFSRQARVLGLVVGIATVVFILNSTLLANLEPPTSTIHVPWWSFVLVFFVAEAFPIHVHIRSEAHTISLSELGLVLALYLVSPSDLLLAQLLGVAVALGLVRKHHPLTLAFNVVVFALGSTIAILTFHGFLLFGDAYGPAGWIGAVLGAAASAAVGLLLVNAFTSLGSTGSTASEWRTLAAVAGSGCFAGASLAIAAIQLANADPRSLWVMFVPIAASALALDAYTSQRRRQGHLEFLSRSMRAMQGAEFSSSVRELLEAARTMLSADVAEIVVFSPSPDEGALRSVVSPTDDVLMQPIVVGETRRRALETVSAHDAAALLPRGRQPHELDDISLRGRPAGRNRHSLARRRPDLRNGARRQSPRRRRDVHA